jgi:Holliday junction resolvase
VQREFAIGSGRVDVTVRWGGRVYVIELKIRTSDKTEAKGIAQLAQYLERFEVGEGYLVLFDRRKRVGWDKKVYERIVEHEGKRIHVFGA